MIKKVMTSALLTILELLRVGPLEGRADLNRLAHAVAGSLLSR
ncbi:MAG: hypothetical protein ACYS15_21220 [Planctomycetota bacterium]|jgi:hypothetical protein